MKKLLFLHIPKTGGSSLRTLLAENAQKRTVSLHPHNRKKAIKHLRADQIKNRRGWKSFAVVRNPYERLYSLYRFIATRSRAIVEMHDQCVASFGDARLASVHRLAQKTGASVRLGCVVWNGIMVNMHYVGCRSDHAECAAWADNHGFEGWIRCWALGKPRSAAVVKWFFDDMFIRPQKDFVEDETQILRFEKLEEDVRLFMQLNGLKGRFPAINRTGSTLPPLSEETARLARDLVRSDAERFGYPLL